jgi:hypothetical protein
LKSVFFVQKAQEHVKYAQSHVKTAQNHVNFLRNFKNTKPSSPSIYKAKPKTNPFQNGEQQKLKNYLQNNKNNL